MSVDSLLTVAWSGFLFLADLGNIGSSSKRLHAALAPDLATIARHLSDEIQQEAQQELFKEWHRHCVVCYPRRDRTSW